MALLALVLKGDRLSRARHARAARLDMLGKCNTHAFHVVSAWLRNTVRGPSKSLRTLTLTRRKRTANAKVDPRFADAFTRLAYLWRFGGIALPHVG